MTTTRVLFVGGTGRSGSTVLSTVLGEVPGLVAVGEVRFLWERGVLQDRLCGCGSAFAECAFWTEVLDLALGTADREETARRLGAELTERTRLRTVPGLLARRTPSAAADLEDTLGRVYAAIAAVSGAQVVVDSSKLPTYAALLGDLPGIDLQVLHLVRDPRAAAHSWRRRKHQPDLGATALMERRGAAKSAALWRIWNGTLEKWCRDRGVDHRLQNYESFIADPPGETRRILRRFDLVHPALVDDVVAG
ncbi:MAG: sulfotransferase, partial [Actinomycetales bacterium]